VNWRLYVVRCSDDTLYTGITNDLERRINEHNTSKRGAKYTKTRRPVELIYYESYKNRSAAQQAEYAFKKLKREQKEKKIQESHNDIHYV
jgi:putative endonuclease